MGPAHQLSGLGGPWAPGPLSLFPVPRALGAGAGGSHVPDPSASRLAFRDSLSTGFSGDVIVNSSLPKAAPLLGRPSGSGLLQGLTHCSLQAEKANLVFEVGGVVGR